MLTKHASENHAANLLEAAYCVSMSFPANLAAAMDRAHLTHQALAERMGVTRTAVSLWLSGKNVPGARRLERLASVLGVSVTDLFAAHASDESAAGGELGCVIGQSGPKVGDPIQDLDEAAIVGFWRKQTFVKKAAIIAQFGWDEMPSMVRKGRPRR